jgi:YHS domain-containing protein
VYDWIESRLVAGRICPPPEPLTDHVCERFLLQSDDEYELLVTSAEAIAHGLDRLDPVCLMEVDPTTPKHTVEYAGRTIAFCAPYCRKQFHADPSAYLGD